MVRAILLGLILKAYLVRAQFPLCSYTNPGNYDVFYANTTSVYAGSTQQYFLCGPNTVLYDTLNNGCVTGMIDSASTVIIKGSKYCPASSIFLVKNYGTLIIQCVGLQVWVCAEPLANIVLQSSVTLVTNTCSTILLPNCAETGFRENSPKRSRVTVFPNPNSGNFVLMLSDGAEKQSAEITIFDIIGRQVYREIRRIDKEQEMKLESYLLNGTYLLKVKLEDGTTDVHRIIINK